VDVSQEGHLAVLLPEVRVVRVVCFLRVVRVVRVVVL